MWSGAAAAKQWPRPFQCWTAPSEVNSDYASTSDDDIFGTDTV
jgi:hypothetical protein